VNKKRIMVVEDEAVTAADLQARLCQLGYEVPAVVASGEDATRIADEMRPDLILMDITLSGPMNGIVAAEEIWRRDKIPVVFLTAHDDALTIKSAKISEPYGYLTKPCDLRTLQSTIEMALYKSGMDARIRESEEHYRALVEGVPGIVYSFSNKRGGVYYSPHVTKLLGYSPEQLYARPMLWNNSIHPEDLPRVEQVIGATGTGKPFSVEYRIQDAHGAWHWLDDRSFGYRRDGAEVIVEGFALDITERKRAENALREKNAELERFTYTVSHDLKSPVITFKTYLGYLEKDLAKGDPELIKQDFGFMHAAADKMEDMLKEILELSRVGRLLNAPVSVTFRELADEAIAAVAGLISQSNATVRTNDIAVTLFGDRPRLAEIWQNLIENAVKYRGEQKTPHIELGAEGKDAERIFFVRDNGMGIDTRHQDQVFGLFCKLDPGSDGSGLGLALVKRIVELYNGRIWFESEGAGKGTCFKFTLPGAVKGN